ncbi:MAG: ABC-type multidrug transport system ATPase subunit/tellurite resistance protein [Marinoscillum sp.]|jgi:ABC-type multidrug transport system ATPase subunit/tellurite resistance protein
MSEEILHAILQLLAIVAKEDEVTSDERASVEKFLNSSLNSETAAKYLNYFDEFTQSLSSVVESNQISEICNKINREQSAQQKVVIILDLIILIAADGQVSEREKNLLYSISDAINVPKSVTDLVKAFVIYQERSKLSSKHILIIDNGTNEIPDNCKHLVREGLEGFLLVLKIPDINSYLLKYIGEDHVLLNDAPMDMHSIYTYASGSSIKGESIDPIYHSEVVNCFLTVASDQHLTFTARELYFKFPNGKIGLHNIKIEEESGKLIALMGGSGAGKSTLLNVLNGNEIPSQGTVRINGVDIHKEKSKIEGVIGYVPQDDLLIEELSVSDNLYFAAKLCFKDLSEGDLHGLVNNTLDALGLYETRYLKVGSPLEKTISGGQRKRLNIGLELLREPSVLFVDEPTSGLSSRDSENIMDLLKELSLKGKMIFVVIHQPSEDIFKMFDKLVVLDVGGYQVYYGNPIDGISYFKEIVKMVDRSRSINPEQIFNIIETKVVNEYGNFTKERKVSPIEWNEHFSKKIEIKSVEETEVIPHKTLSIPGKLKQFLIFTIRDFKSKLSNKQYLTINLLEAPVLAIVLAFIIRYLPEDTTVYHFKENLNIPVFFFMSVIVSLFMGLTVSAEEIIKDRKILKREEFLNLSRGSYLFSKLAILFGISAFQTCTYILIGSWILGVQGMFFPFWAVLFSVSCFANILGLNVSSAFKSAITVYILIPLLVIPQLILSGVVVNFDKLNPLITTEDKVPMIGEIMASRWAFEALAVEQFKANPYSEIFYEDEKVMGQSEFKTSYFLPRLIDDLEFVNKNYKNEDLESERKVYNKFQTIKNALDKELSKLGYDKFPEFENFNLEKWNNSLYNSTTIFIEKLKAYYNVLYKNANAIRQTKLKELTDTPEKRQAYDELKKENLNDALAIMVKNLATEHRILEHNNEYVQKLYPIYHEPEFPKHALDFRAQFYQPTKHFGGLWFSTLQFNVFIIWMMSLGLFLLLYMDGLKRLLDLFDR